MRKLSKVLSILLAMALIFTTASIGVEAQYHAYKDTQMSYNSIDQPILDTDQYASMAMDELDRMLKKENITINEEFFGLTLSADFSTIDNALDSIASVLATFGGMLSRIGGDVQNLDFSALCDKNNNYALVCPHRDDEGYSDLDIFKAVFQFLADNAEIIAKVPKGSKENGGLDLGALSGFIDLGDKLNVPELVKKAVAKFMNAEFDASKTLDSYLSDFLQQVLGGTYPKSGNSTIYWVSQEVKYYVPGITSQVDFMNDSVYDIVESCIRAALDSDKAMDFINRTVQRWLRQFCGYAYIKSEDANGDTIYTRDPENDDIKEDYVALVNLDFTLTSFNTSSWGANTTFVDHANDILGKIVQAAFKPSTGITWNYANGNNGLLANIRNAVTVVLEYTGSGLFASYIQPLPIEQVRAMTDNQFVAYILRATMNGSIDAVYIQDSVNTIMGVLFETVRTLAGEVIPSQNYDALQPSLDNLIRMGLDIAAAGLKGVSSLDLDFGLSLDAFAEEAVEWVKQEYGGFVSEINSTGWDAVSEVLFTVIPADWLPAKGDGSDRDDVRSIIFDDLVDNILDLDLPAILSLASRNPTGDLNNTLIEVLLGRVVAVANYIIPDTFPDTYDYDSLEVLLNTDLLHDVIYGFVTGLYDRFDDLAVSLLPLICSILDLSTAEEFGYPYVSLEDSRVLDPTLNNTFYMYNGSSGINTAWTNKNGVTTRDELYKYKINSITVDNDDISVVTEAGRTPAGTWIPGGISQTFKFDGDLSDAMDTVLTITITYDVYGETDQKMTTAPLTTTSYVYISDAIDNAELRKEDAQPANMHLLYLAPAVYLRTGTKLSEIGDIEVEIRRNAAQQASAHSKSSVVRLTGIVLDETLADLGVSANTDWTVTTNKNGGSYKCNPYIVSANGDTPLDTGIYTNALSFFAQATESAAETWQRPQNIWVFDDYDLSSYLRNAVRADRQQSSFGTGSFTASYIPFDELRNVPEDATAEDLEAMKESETVNGAEAWEAYTEAVKAAAAIIYAPRQVGQYDTAEDMSDAYYTAAYDLYTATQQLEACSVSSGAAGVKTALNAIIPDDTVPVLDEDGNVKLDEKGHEIKESVPYYDDNHTYFGRADYVSYTYSRFKPERRAAERLINRWQKGIDGEDVEPISAVEAAYATHRLNLYASRLIRVKAYKQHLNTAINNYTATLNAGQGKYSTESWTDFVTAYNFAVQVNNKAIGATVSGSDNLAGEGLRQTMVNEARGQLIKSAKKLVEAKTDFSKLNKLINTNKPIYEAGNTGYTPASWAAFETAYLAAVSVKNNAEATQTQVNSAYDELLDKAGKLTAVQTGGIELEEVDGFVPKLIEGAESGKPFMVGLDPMNIALDDLSVYVNAAGGYTFDFTPNESQGVFSTGATFTVYDANHEVVETYELVMYGDLTGEGMIDVDDANVLIAICCWEDVGDWAYSPVDETALGMAADTFHDGLLDISDANQIISVMSWAEEINQNWAQDGDPYSFVLE